MEYQQYYICNASTQTTETDRTIWVQIADALTTFGRFLVSVGQVLIRIGEIIYRVIFH